MKTFFPSWRDYNAENVSWLSLDYHLRNKDKMQKIKNKKLKTICLLCPFLPSVQILVHVRGLES